MNKFFSYLVLYIMDDHNLFNKTKFLLQIISFNQVMLHKNLRKWRDFYNPYCNCSVADPDPDPNPDPDPPDPRVFGPPGSGSGS